MAFSLLAPISAPAQYDTASVLGTIRDASGGVIAGASITLRNVDTGSVANTKTDSNGDYQFTNVRIGSYEVTAEQTGFSSFIVRDVIPTVNARLRVDVTTKIGSVSEQVVVNGTAAALETDSSERGQVINSEQIANLHLRIGLCLFETAWAYMAGYRIWRLVSYGRWLYLKPRMPPFVFIFNIFSPMALTCRQTC